MRFARFDGGHLALFLVDVLDWLPGPAPQPAADSDSGQAQAQLWHSTGLRRRTAHGCGAWKRLCRLRHQRWNQNQDESGYTCCRGLQHVTPRARVSPFTAQLYPFIRRGVPAVNATLGQHGTLPSSRSLHASLAKVRAVSTQDRQAAEISR